MPLAAIPPLGPGAPLRLALAALAVTLAACGGADTTPAVAPGPSPDASNPAASTDSIPATAVRSDSSSVDYDAPVTLVSMANGDRACYLTVRTDGGAERTEFGDFRLCESDEFVGQRVVLTATPSPVQAASCQGDPDCTDSEQVNLVTNIDPAPANEPAAPAGGIDG